MKTLIHTYANHKDENGNPVVKVVHVQSTTGTPGKLENLWEWAMDMRVAIKKTQLWISILERKEHRKLFKNVNFKSN